MSMAQLQQAWTILLPIIVFAFSYVIQREKWSKETNGLIALGMVFIAAIASILLQDGNITDTGLVIALTTASQSEALAPLMPYVRAFPGLPLSAQAQIQKTAYSTTPLPPAQSAESGSQPPK